MMERPHWGLESAKEEVPMFFKKRAHRYHEVLSGSVHFRNGLKDRWRRGQENRTICKTFKTFFKNLFKGWKIKDV